MRTEITDQHRKRLGVMTEYVTKINLGRMAICVCDPETQGATPMEEWHEPHWIVFALQDIAEYCRKSHMVEIEVLLRRTIWEIDHCLHPKVPETPPEDANDIVAT